MSKEFKMGFIEEVEPLKLTTIPKKYQKLIEATENRWFNKMQKLAKICQKRIVELENEVERLQHRLSNCIEPKFEYGQQVFYIANGHILSKWFYACESKDGIIISRYLHSQGEMVYRRKPKDLVFATEEEAKAKLEELKSDN